LIGFSFSVPIALLGGLMGLGGAEYRLPVLRGPMRYLSKQAIPINLAISLVTLAVSLITRVNALSVTPLGALLPVVLSMIAGALVTAFFGPSFVGQVSERRLEQAILAYLIVIGAALIVEGFAQTTGSGVIASEGVLAALSGFLFGLVIGAASGVFGVAGGEIIIPTLVFVYGVDIKIAGTASIIVSLPAVAMGLARFAKQGAFKQRESVSEAIGPMGVGSVFGAIAGGLLVGLVSAQVLKVVLGIVLIVSALRIFGGSRTSS